MNWFVKCLMQYADFKGRARRSEFWWFVLISFIISVILQFVLGMLAGSGVGRMVSQVYSLAVLLPSLGVAARRLHDIGKTGWFMLIPFYNLYLFAQDGTPGRNPYGENPKA